MDNPNVQHMTANRLIFSNRLVWGLALLLCAGFMTTSWSGYQASRTSIRSAIIDTELPLTADNIYSEIRKDLVSPVLISSTMAQDTYLRDWVIDGERDPQRITRYLNEVKSHYKASTTFFVSERSRVYYHASGPLHTIDPAAPKDSWYARVRTMSDPYEINVDVDSANPRQLAIFINYRVLDYNGNLLGATGIGLTVDAVMAHINRYQETFKRKVYFVEPLSGRVIMSGTDNLGQRFADIPGLATVGPQALTVKSGVFSYVGPDGTRLLHVREIPELKWHLFVERNEDDALADIRHATYINLLICLVVTAFVTGVAKFVLGKHHRRLEAMATTDALTGLANRNAFDILFRQALRNADRTHSALSVILFDLDHFKRINDTHGHLAGDQALQTVATVLRQHLRENDIFARWGGEEFLVMLQNTAIEQAVDVAEKLRSTLASHNFTVNGARIALSASFGVAQRGPSEAEDPLLTRVDSALYAAKHAGRNCVQQA